MKKILSLILAISMGFSIMSFSALAQEESIDAELSEAMEVLRLFDIISDYYDYNTNYQQEVSRADFAEAVSKLMGNSSYESKDIYYYDVPENHYAYKSIAMLTEMGIINGVGDNLFKPDDFIEDAQAYKILLSAMGYSSIADADGGYPNGYNAIARRLGIFPDIDNTNYLTYRDMFLILYKALDVNIMESVRYQNEYVEYKVSEDETLLTMFRDLYKEKGILNGANMIFLNDTNGRDEKEVVIGNTVYSADVDLGDLLGEEIEYYVKKDLKKDKGTIVWAKPTGKSKVTFVNTEDVKDFDTLNYTLTYYTENGRKKSLDLVKGASIIFNGVEIGSKIKEAFTVSNGEIKIVENNGVCTAAIIKAYENYIVNSVNISTGTVYDKRGSAYSLVIDENKADFITLRNAAGIALKLEEIASGAVVSVYKSRDGKYIDAIVNSEKISGILEGVSEKYNGISLKIDGNSYLLKQTDGINIPKVGSTVEVYLDFAGNAVYIEKSSGVNFAAFVKYGAIMDDGFDSRCGLKVFTEAGEHKELYCAKKTTVDGKVETDAKNILNALSPGGQVKPQLVLLKINADNEITMIDTQKVNEPYESEKNSLSMSTVRSGTWVRGSGSFNKMSVVNSNTKFIGIPSEINESTPDKAYSLPGRPSNDSTYSIETYKTTDRVGYEEYVLVFVSAGAALDDNLPVVVESVGTSVSSDGDVGECIWGYQGKNEVMLMSDGNISFKEMGIDKGMIVRFANDQSGYVTAAEIVFDINNKDAYMTKSEDFRYAAEYSCSVGYLHDVVDGVPSISWSDIKKVDHRIAPFTAPVIIYDTSVTENNISVGSLLDGITAYDAGEDCSIIVAIEESAHAQLFVLYN